MKNLKSTLQLLADVQILSALIWAISIIACSWVADKNNISTILITAAGFHVILMAQFKKTKTTRHS